MSSTFHFQVASCKNIFMKNNRCFAQLLQSLMLEECCASKLQYLGTDSSATFANHPDELHCLSMAAGMKMSRKQHLILLQSGPVGCIRSVMLSWHLEGRLVCTQKYSTNVLQCFPTVTSCILKLPCAPANGTKTKHFIRLITSVCTTRPKWASRDQKRTGHA